MGRKSRPCPMILNEPKPSRPKQSIAKEVLDEGAGRSVYAENRDRDQNVDLETFTSLGGKV